MEPRDELKATLVEFGLKLEGIEDEAALYELQVEYLGKKGLVTQMRGLMGKLPPDARKGFGQAFNEVKEAIERALQERREAFAEAERQRRLSQREDLTMLPRRRPAGSLHPITHTRRRLEAVFRQMGYDVVDGPHVEHEKYNFDDLNFLAEHPAREMQDTFFVHERPGAEPAPLVLRTHTSPVQIRAMLTRKPPVRVIAYRG